MSWTNGVGLDVVVLLDGGGDIKVELWVFWDILRMALAVCLELSGHPGHAFAGFPELLLQLIPLGLELLDLLPFPLPRVVCRQTVSLHALDPTLLLLVLCLGPFAGREVGLGLGKDLAP